MLQKSEGYRWGGSDSSGFVCGGMYLITFFMYLYFTWEDLIVGTFDFYSITFYSTVSTCTFNLTTFLCSISLHITSKSHCAFFYLFISLKVTNGERGIGALNHCKARKYS